MSSFDEAKSPLTLLNIQAWARTQFLDVFDAMPPLEKVTFIDVDDMIFDRTVRRSLGRSIHKKLLLVGAHSPESDVEDVEVCAHIHADEDEVTLYHVHELENETKQLLPVASLGHVAFHPPFSEVGDDVQRVLAVVRYYFLLAGYLKELPRHKRAPKNFAKMFKEACRWIANDGECPHTAFTASVSRFHAAQQPAGGVEPTNYPAINPSVLRSATRQRKPIPIKRARSNTNIKELSTQKRPAFADISSNIPRATKKPSPAEEPAVQSEVTVLKAQVVILTAENVKLKEDMAMQGHAYRGLQLELDETKEVIADMEAKMNAEQANYMYLRRNMSKIKEVVNGSGV